MKILSTIVMTIVILIPNVHLEPTTPNEWDCKSWRKPSILQDHTKCGKASETVGMFYEWELHYNSNLNELKDKEALLGKYAYIATVKNGSPIYIQDKATHDSTPIKHGISTLLKDWKNDGTWIGTRYLEEDKMSSNAWLMSNCKEELLGSCNFDESQFRIRMKNDTWAKGVSISLNQNFPKYPGFDCNHTQDVDENLDESKKVCRNDPECTGILDKRCTEQGVAKKFYHCVANHKYLVESDDDVFYNYCVYKKCGNVECPLACNNDSECRDSEYCIDGKCRPESSTTEQIEVTTSHQNSNDSMTRLSTGTANSKSDGMTKREPTNGNSEEEKSTIPSTKKSKETTSSGSNKFNNTQVFYLFVIILMTAN